MNSIGTSMASMLIQSPRAYASGVVLRQIGEVGNSSKFAGLTAATEIRLRFLGESLAADRSAIFEDHMRWAKVVHAAQSLDSEEIEANLEAMAAELADCLPAPGNDKASEFVLRGLEAFLEASPVTESHITDDQALAGDAREYMVAVLEARIADAIAIIDRLLDAGHAADEVLSGVIVTVQREIGRLWQIGDATVADEHLSSRTAERVIAALHERVRGEGQRRRVIFAASDGDPHDLGQRIASLYFEIAGWDPIVFGASMPEDSLVQAVGDYEADVIALSLQIGLHVRTTARLIQSLRTGSSVPIMLGGRMLEVVPDLWQVLGADGGASDASEAVRVADGLSRET